MAEFSLSIASNNFATEYQLSPFVYLLFISKELDCDKKSPGIEDEPVFDKKLFTQFDKPIRIFKHELRVCGLLCQPENLSIAMGVDLHLLLVRQVGMFPTLYYIHLYHTSIYR